MSRRRLAAVALIGALAGTLLGGCQQLFGMGGLPLSGCDSPSTPPTTYTQGSATLTFSTRDPGTITLGKLDTSLFPAVFDPSCSGSATAQWTDAAGTWTLTLFTSVDGGSGVMAGMDGLYIEDEAANPTRYADGTSCTIETTEASSKALSGHAECHGMRWMSSIDEQAFSPAPASDHPSFDVTVTFEARP